MMPPEPRQPRIGLTQGFDLSTCRAVDHHPDPVRQGAGACPSYAWPVVSVAFSAVAKRFGDREVLRPFTLDVDDGTICCIIGPSGCGKSTVLRLLAGLEEPTSGEVRIGGQRVNERPTRDRRLGMVMQHQTLPAHRKARESVALPLTIHGVPVAEIDERIRAEASTFGVADLLDRRPDQLSGGERRAVEVARALVGRPEVLLLDEPLAHLDPTRRLAIRVDLVRLHTAYGVTTIWVTADQADAMAVADRLAVLVDGRLHQVGAPLEVHDRPATVDVARFVGDPEMAIVEATVRGAPGDLWYEIGPHRFRARVPAAARYVGRSVLLGIRAHEVTLSQSGPGTDRTARADEVALVAVVTVVEPQGHRTVAELVVGPATLRSDTAPIGTRVGDHLAVTIDPGRFHLFDPHTGVAVHHADQTRAPGWS